MQLKRIVLLTALLAALVHTTAWAQERGPLVMQIEFQWTLVGVVAGVAVGGLLWLTDPASPGNNLPDSVARGAAWGSILGAGFGVYVMQRSAIYPPGVAVHDPLAPANRISADPVAEQSGEAFLMAHRNAAAPHGPELRLPLLSLHF